MKARAGDYNFDTSDIDPTPGEATFIQKAGMTDYELVKGLANLTGYIMWVDYNEAIGKWQLHFRDPARALEQLKTYTFEYNNGDFSTLLEFEPESAVKGTNTKITVQFRNPATGKLMEETIDEADEGGETPDLKFNGFLDEKISGPLTSGTAVKLFFNDFSFDVIAARRFKDEQTLRAWARRWFKSQRDNFVLARGTLIGIEDLKARQVHNLSGVGKAYSGAYYFNSVRHIFDKDNGYVTEFNARKVIS